MGLCAMGVDGLIGFQIQYLRGCTRVDAVYVCTSYAVQ